MINLDDPEEIIAAERRAEKVLRQHGIPSVEWTALFNPRPKVCIDAIIRDIQAEARQ